MENVAPLAPKCNGAVALTAPNFNPFAEPPGAFTRWVQAGFTDLIPIIPPGSPLSPGSTVQPGMLGKTPGMFLPHNELWCGYPDFTNVIATDAEIAVWDTWPGAGVGLIGREYNAADCDVTDPVLNEAIGELADQMLPMVPRRIGNPPKWLSFWRCPGEFAKVQISFTNGSPAGMLELLGNGQQWVVEGTHAKTGGPYTYQGVHPLQFGAAHWPEVSVELLRKFAHAVIEHATKLGYTAEVTMGKASLTGQVYEPTMTPGEYDEEWAVEYARSEIAAEKGEWGRVPTDGNRNTQAFKRACRLWEVGVPEREAIGMLRDWCALGQKPDETIESLIARPYHHNAAQSAFGSKLPPKAQSMSERAAAMGGSIEAEFFTTAVTDTPMVETEIADECEEDFDDAQLGQRIDLARDRFAAGNPILLSGPSGIGKSMALQQMLKALVYGREMFDPLRPIDNWPIMNQFGQAIDRDGKPFPWCAPPVGVEIGHIEYLNYELKDVEVKRRGRAIVKGMRLEKGKDTPSAAFKRHDLRKSRTPVARLSQDKEGNVKVAPTEFGIGLMRRLKAIAGKLDGKHMVLVIDGLTNGLLAVAGSGKGKLNDDIVQTMMYLLARWCELLNATVIAAVHPSWSAESRGGNDIGQSQEYTKVSDQIVSVSSTDKGQKTLTLKVTKWRDGPHWEVTMGRVDGIWVAGAKGGPLDEFAAVEKVYLEAVYGPVDLAALQAGGLSAEEITEIEQKHPARMRKEGHGLRWGEGKTTRALKDKDRMVQDVAELTSNRFTARQFNAALAMLAEPMRAKLGYRTKDAHRGGELPAGFCFPYPELVTAARGESMAQAEANMAPFSGPVVGHA